MSDGSSSHPRYRRYSEVATLGEIPARGTREAVRHLARLANGDSHFAGKPVSGRLIWLANELNKQLPPKDRVPVAELEAIAPFQGDPELIGQFAVATIGEYMSNPANAPILQARQRAYIALERYFIWCRGLWKAVEASRPAVDAFRFDPEVASPQDDIGEHSLGAMLHWLASLCVVIEGWEELEFHDEAIDDLLDHGGDPKIVGTLRHRLQRFRNGVFHFQPTGTEDPRFKDFWSDQVVNWAIPLERQFERFFRDAWSSNQASIEEWLFRGLDRRDPQLPPDP